MKVMVHFTDPIEAFSSKVSLVLMKAWILIGMMRVPSMVWLMVTKFGLVVTIDGVSQFQPTQYFGPDEEEEGK